MANYDADYQLLLDDEGYNERQEREGYLGTIGTPCPCGEDHAVALKPYAPGWYAYGWKPEGTIRHALSVLGPYQTEALALVVATAAGLGGNDYGDRVQMVYRPDPHLPRVEDL